MSNKKYTQLLEELAKKSSVKDESEAPLSEIEDFNRQQELEMMYNRF